MAKKDCQQKRTKRRVKEVRRRRACIVSFSYSRFPLRCTAPLEPPRNVKAERAGSDSVKVSWSPPHSDSFQGTLTGYEIRIRDRIEKIDIVHVTRKNELSAVIHLPNVTNDRFFVKVAAVTSFPGVYSEEIPVVQNGKFSCAAIKNISILHYRCFGRRFVACYYYVLRYYYSRRSDWNIHCLLHPRASAGVQSGKVRRL